MTLLLGGLALAASAMAAGLPPERQAGGVSYVSGGVSADEAEAFKAMRNNYPLAIELVQQVGGRNMFTADAKVRVMDSAGHVVLDARADGPFMLVRLPPGRYRVEATFKGMTTESPATVNIGGHAQATLNFPGSPD
ncbi:carboxypeptidase regulatory-like domain-containing protein [Albitalea terrae]|uniref:Carboxypeptidase regulatory-like domain-containing protein n=2 Tax=Piscinibacter terrae TaxID=2496871 RepID=A0A3N7HUM4_9BURK|nr:carboxypeptidase regulatory-like domain-containing protein [Albitalea terrae]